MKTIRVLGFLSLVLFTAWLDHKGYQFLDIIFWYILLAVFLCCLVLWAKIDLLRESNQESNQSNQKEFKDIKDQLSQIQDRLRRM